MDNLEMKLALLKSPGKKKKIKLYDGTEISPDDLKKYDDRRWWSKAKKER